MTKRADSKETKAAVEAIRDWIQLTDPVAVQAEMPPRSAVATAVRLSARTLAAEAPGHSVEVRVPPFVAVQCVDGPRHTRGTPPNVVECSAHVWLRLACGLVSWEEADISASGSRAGEICKHLPVVRLSVH